MTWYCSFLAAIATAGLATGCGSEAPTSKTDEQPAEPKTTQADKPKTTQTDKPKSHRTKMVECIEGVGFGTAADDDPNNISDFEPERHPASCRDHS